MALAPTQSLVDTPSRAYYRQAMEVLTRAQVPFLVGGAFAWKSGKGSGNGAIVGRVFDAATNTPVRRAQIQGSNNELFVDALSDEDDEVAGLIETRRVGRETICTLRPEAFGEVAERQRAILGIAS